MRITFLIRMSTHDAQADALGGREAGELQADEPAGESPRQGLQVPGEAAESARFQQAEHGAGDVGGRASREQSREGHLKKKSPPSNVVRARRRRNGGRKVRAEITRATLHTATGVNCAAVRILNIRAAERRRADPSSTDGMRAQ